MNSVDPETDSSGKQLCEDVETLKKCSSRISTVKALFNIYYYNPYESDIINLKMRFFQFYKSYILENPTITTKVDNCFKEIELQDINIDTFHQKYGDSFWIKLYFDLRLAEANISLTKFAYQKHLKKIIQLRTLNSPYRVSNFEDIRLDFQKALKYINDMAKGKINMSLIYGTESQQKTNEQKMEKFLTIEASTMGEYSTAGPTY